jgi:hypothetical protein
MSGLTELQRVAAGMIGRGTTHAAVTEAIGPSKSTLQRWRKMPAFEAEVERVRASSEKPDARGVLLDALSAHRSDGADWPTRVRAAIALTGLPGTVDPTDTHAGPKITVVAAS